MTTLNALNLPFEEAIAYLQQKTNTTSEHWTDVFGRANAKSFTVAGATTRDLVADFRAEVTKAIEKGTSLQEFRKSFDDIVSRHGWEHTGTPGWRARIIYETNLGMAYAAGRYQQMTEPETLAAFPYWQYVHSGSLHPRPHHKAWDGTVLRADDPWWDSHYPPNGWRCGCRVRPVSARGMARMGRTGPDSAPVIDTRPWVNPHTGEVLHVPVGIDPGFGYNPGREWKAERVELPANATLRMPEASTPPAQTRAAAVEDFARRVLAGEINDPARSIVAAELPERLAVKLPGVERAGRRIELSAFRVLKVDGRAREMAGKPSTAHPEVTPRHWGQLQQLLKRGRAYREPATNGGRDQLYVIGEIDGRQMMAVIRPVTTPAGETRLTIPTFHEVGERRLRRLQRQRTLHPIGGGD